MQGIQIGLFVTRIWLLICACIVLGTSVDITNFVKDVCDYIHRRGGHDCGDGNLLPPFEYCIFVGVWGLVQFLEGMAGVFVPAMPWIATIVVDALALIFDLAGGIALAVLIGRGGECHAGPHCNVLYADVAFLFLGFFGSIAAITLVYMWQRRR